ncbi:hypothetical protein PoB_000231900 [Plakobranchus ocellatus]|uniref:Uncharacterized protein n=1 Tax=Plakobranchus ocellatus TaxID=259542 RepID=A0AAV3Y0R7_9GAST|nr:hypothetical protein PoB_000231900 [Plakobranchus ocellatus]
MESNEALNGGITAELHHLTQILRDGFAEYQRLGREITLELRELRCAVKEIARAKTISNPDRSGEFGDQIQTQRQPMMQVTLPKQSINQSIPLPNVQLDPPQPQPQPQLSHIASDYNENDRLMTDVTLLRENTTAMEQTTVKTHLEETDKLKLSVTPDISSALTKKQESTDASKSEAEDLSQQAARLANDMKPFQTKSTSIEVSTHTSCLQKHEASIQAKHRTEDVAIETFKTAVQNKFRAKDMSTQTAQPREERATVKVNEQTKKIYASKKLPETDDLKDTTEVTQPIDQASTQPKILIEEVSIEAKPKMNEIAVETSRVVKQEASMQVKLETKGVPVQTAQPRKETVAVQTKKQAAKSLSAQSSLQESDNLIVVSKVFEPKDQSPQVFGPIDRGAASTRTQSTGEDSSVQIPFILKLFPLEARMTFQSVTFPDSINPKLLGTWNQQNDHGSTGPPLENDQATSARHNAENDQATSDQQHSDQITWSQQKSGLIGAGMQAAELSLSDKDILIEFLKEPISVQASEERHRSASAQQHAEKDQKTSADSTERKDLTSRPRPYGNEDLTTSNHLPRKKDTLTYDQSHLQKYHTAPEQKDHTTNNHSTSVKDNVTDYQPPVKIEQTKHEPHVVKDQINNDQSFVEEDQTTTDQSTVRKEEKTNGTMPAEKDESTILESPLQKDHTTNDQSPVEKSQTSNDRSPADKDQRIRVKKSTNHNEKVVPEPTQRQSLILMTQPIVITGPLMDVQPTKTHIETDIGQVTPHKPDEEAGKVGCIDQSKQLNIRDDQAAGNSFHDETEAYGEIVEGDISPSHQSMPSNASNLSFDVAEISRCLIQSSSKIPVQEANCACDNLNAEITEIKRTPTGLKIHFPGLDPHQTENLIACLQSLTSPLEAPRAGCNT